MAKLKRNIWNPEAAEDWLNSLSDIHGGEDQERLRTLMILALKTPLLNTPSCSVKLTDLPENAPSWLQKKWNAAAAGDFYTFVPDETLRGDITHIRDWIVSALKHKKDWIKPDKPERLKKLSTMRDAKNAADKDMLKAAQRLAVKFKGVGDNDGDIEVVKTFEDGFAIVRLLTQTALQRESAMMNHCVGEGAYNDGLEGDNTIIYSLRDPKNEAHATIEVQGNTMKQCKGKQDLPPVAKYFPYLKEFITENGFELEESPRFTGVIKAGGEYYSINDLPDGLEFDKGLILVGTDIEALPNNIKVLGTFMLIGCKNLRSWPENIEATDPIIMPDGNLCMTVDDAREWFIDKFGEPSPDSLA